MIRILSRLFSALLFSLLVLPAHAMWISPDWWEVTDPGVGTNRYAYAHGDPVNLRDPGGNATVFTDEDGDGLNETGTHFDPNSQIGSDLANGSFGSFWGWKESWGGLRNEFSGFTGSQYASWTGGGFSHFDEYGNHFGVSRNSPVTWQANGTTVDDPTKSSSYPKLKKGWGYAALLESLLDAARGHPGDRYFHYTNARNAGLINQSKVIKQNRKGWVYVTQSTLSSSDAYQNLFLNSPDKIGHGDFVVSIAGNSDFRTLLTPDPSIPIGRRHPGSIRHGRGGASIIGVIPNPF